VRPRSGCAQSSKRVAMKARVIAAAAAWIARGDQLRQHATVDQHGPHIVECRPCCDGLGPFCGSPAWSLEGRRFGTPTPPRAR